MGKELLKIPLDPPLPGESTEPYGNLILRAEAPRAEVRTWVEEQERIIRTLIADYKYEQTLQRVRPLMEQEKPRYEKTRDDLLAKREL